MGTYLSVYIEVDASDCTPPFSDPEQIQSLTEGAFAFGKDYEVFDAIAGGREAFMRQEDRHPRRNPLIAPRGMPSPCSLAVGQDYYHLIAEAPGLPDRHFWPAWRCVSPENASGWLRAGGCHEAEFLQWINGRRLWRVISHPGLRGASWLRLAEFESALAHRGLTLARLPVEYRILHSAMSLLAEERGAERVRMVVWFS